ncbi:iron complex outermembrane receptor protein [Sphingobium sp. B1D7B]|uniref:TonB-dependent receptor plug domain-containing protein n=1 Tax=Sphingobium sp. B1D7B TaxID=2940578 RepID=UPI00222461F2|nr:TonB-dependent receptor [Sphingobium sp. B1D7B]MCW2404636.1 iron complex outermembrane receptor protein [Sphingobium sp. B1D7B]
MTNTLRLMLASVGLVALSTAAHAQETAAADDSAYAEQDIVVTGTRVAGRTRLDTTSPVDVLSGEALRGQGTAELGQALANVAPSINFPRSSAVDATDSIRPATLRGLSPDQTLVLVNGVRGHTSALLNTNGSVGRGAAAFDLNTIPTIALESVEVLRDGASAQYGSDAIAGVVNLRLREARSGGGATLGYGQYVTDVSPARSSRKAHDGETLTASLWQGIALGTDGFLTLSADYLNRGRTSRGDVDTRFTPAIVSSRFGDPEVEQYTLFANFGAPVGGTWQVYGHAGYQKRDSTGAALPRPLSNANSVPAIYPNGFTPLINVDSKDINTLLGVKGEIGDWAVDINASYGRNTLTFETRRSLNSTYGTASQTDFYSGRLTYDQWTGGADVTRKIALAGDNSLNVAFGVEGRRESFEEEAGEPASYNRGPLGANVALGSGAQGFAGFRPADAGKNSRENIGAYLDLEAQIANLTVGAAGRYEHYSTFGDNGTGKVSLRYDFAPQFALRATASTGFRAPSLQQQFYSFTQSTSINNVIVDVRTQPSTTAAAVALGGQALRPEKSTNLSAGAVFRTGGLEFTVDAYRIRVRDQIALSENLAIPGVGTTDRARFFINGIRSTTKGVDVIARYRLTSDTLGKFDLTAAGNYNEVTITDAPGTTPGGAALFSQQRITSLERGTPRWKGSAAADWSLGNVGATLRATYYGNVVEPAPNVIDYVNTGKHTLIDLEGRVKLMQKGTLAIGANNLFDVYPDAVATTNGNNYNAGATAFPYYSPFGFNGRYVYARFSLNW